MKNQLVIGLGEIGSPLKQVLSLGPDTIYGRDLEDPKDLPDTWACVHICFPYSDEFVFLVVDYLKQYKPELCIVHSTVVPFTMEKINVAIHNELDVFDEFPDVIFSPVRGRHGEMTRDLLRYNKFYAGFYETSNAKAAHILESAGFAVRQMDSVSGLELAKLLETSYSGLLIAWAQEMSRYCKKADADYMDLVQFFAEISYLPNYIFQPGIIGGHCIMQNLKLLDEFLPAFLVTAIQFSNAKRDKNYVSSGARLKPLPWSDLK
jgi:UDP-glucose 6-dehydrogenase